MKLITSFLAVTSYPDEVLILKEYLKIFQWLGMLTHTCSPSYSWDSDQADGGSKLAQVKSYINAPSQQKQVKHGGHR
jgi:hypothetical protein